MAIIGRSSKKMNKGCGFVFFGIFALAGIFALIGVVPLVWEGLRSRFWTPTPATIIRSEIKPEHGDFLLDVAYYYTFEGREFTGTRLRPNKTAFEREHEAKRVQQRYRSDRRVTCYVNPANPEESYLERESLLFALFLLLPFVFITVGVGGIVLMRRGDKRKPISARHRQGIGLNPLRLFGAVFMLVGGGFMYGFGIGPWLKARDAADWKEVPCTITASDVSSHRSSKGGTSYSLVIQYDYQFDGQTYSSDRYNFGIDGSGTRGWREEAAKTYPVGKPAMCYVNPAEPSEAVLVREGGIGWLILIPGVFFTVGLLVFVNAGRMMNGSKSKNRGRPTAAPAAASSVGGLRGTLGESAGAGISLTPAVSPLASFLILLMVALIWNGIVFGVLFLADLPTGGKVFLSIFALIGIGLLAGAVHQFLSMFNPRPTVQATANSLRLGESLDVRFSFHGRTQRIQRLKIAIKGEEAATYRRGTDSRTDRHVFHEAVLFDSRDPGSMQAGSVTLTIPTDSMHTFDGGNNKITWKLELHGEIPRWPDVKLDFPITVLPHPIASTP